MILAINGARCFAEAVSRQENRRSASQNQDDAGRPAEALADAWGVPWCREVAAILRKMLKRSTRKPKAMMAMPVRTQARKVRSLAA
jgi:hypothetical protein